MIQRTQQYFKQSWGEIQKVTWPKPASTRTYTIIVVLVSLAFAVFLGGLDYIFSYLVRQFLL